MHLAIILMGINKHLSFFQKYHETATAKLLPNTKKTFFVFTNIDHHSLYQPDVKICQTKHLNWPFITLLRFHLIDSIKGELLSGAYTHLMFVDADMYVNDTITEDEFNSVVQDKPFFGVQHPGFVGKLGTFETNQNSLAAVNQIKDLSNYWQGCFWGGRLPEVMSMVAELKDYTQRDLDNEVIAVWHDESHLNRYYVDHKDKVATFHPGFAYPELWQLPYDKKIVHVAKDNSQLHR